MKVENAMYPDGQPVAALLGDSSVEPIVMLNLLKFRARAKYADGPAGDLTGQQGL